MKLKLTVDRKDEESLSWQIYEQIRQMILSGELEAGLRLPATRDLSIELDISRPTLAAGLAQLCAEGYLEVKRGLGTFVCSQLKSGAGALLAEQEPARRPTELPLSDCGEFVEELSKSFQAPQEHEISFYCWRPALDQFPSTEWARVMGREARNSEIELLDHSWDSRGTVSLRKELAGLAERFRSLPCDPDQIVLTMGLNQAIDLVARLHLNHGNKVAVDDPGYSFGWSIFRSYGANVIPVPVDSDGLQVAQLEKLSRVKLLYLTPSHHFPTGAVMPLSRRLELLEWARKESVIILEDDYDSEYQDRARPIPALKSLDKSGQVIYAGTLNQIMFPSLGLAYLILPESLVPLYRMARQLAGEQMPTHLQAAVTEFISTGHLERHVKRLRSLYRDRRNELVGALKKRFGNKVSISKQTSGVFILARFESRLNTDEIISRAAKLGLGLTASRDFYMGKAPKNEFVLGFASLDSKKIQEGVKRLANVIL